MSLREVTISELEREGCILAIQDGNHGEKHPKSTDYVEEGVPFVMASDIRQGRVDVQGANKLPQTITDRLRIGFCQGGDVLLSHKGSVGYVAIAPEHEPYLMLTPQVTYYRVDKRRLLPEFLSYAFRDPQFQKRLVSTAGQQGTRGYVGVRAQRQLEVWFADLSIQKGIVDAVHPYDDLIENNRRRMALLEEAARQLYREWFVRLRFPGHEHARIIDGVPEAWERKTLEEVCAEGNGIQTGPFGSQLHQSDYSDSGVPVVMPKDLADLRVDTDHIARVPDEIAERLERHRLRVGDTVYGRRGDIGRRAYIGERQAGFLCGTGSLRIRPDSARVSPRYLFDTLGTPETAGTIANRAKGATMLNLNQKVLKSVPVLLAPRRLQDLYVEQVQDIAEQRELLLEMNRGLRKVRDLLLPRFMSSEIAV